MMKNNLRQMCINHPNDMGLLDIYSDYLLENKDSTRNKEQSNYIEKLKVLKKLCWYRWIRWKDENLYFGIPPTERPNSYSFDYLALASLARTTRGIIYLTVNMNSNIRSIVCKNIKEAQSVVWEYYLRDLIIVDLDLVNKIYKIYSKFGPREDVILKDWL